VRTGTRISILRRAEPSHGVEIHLVSKRR